MPAVDRSLKIQEIAVKERSVVRVLVENGVLLATGHFQKKTRTYDWMEWILCFVFTKDIFSLTWQRGDLIVILIRLSITGQYNRVKYCHDTQHSSMLATRCYFKMYSDLVCVSREQQKNWKWLTLIFMEHRGNKGSSEIWHVAKLSVFLVGTGIGWIKE